MIFITHKLLICWDDGFWKGEWETKQWVIRPNRTPNSRPNQSPNSRLDRGHDRSLSAQASERPCSVFYVFRLCYGGD